MENNLNAKENFCRVFTEYTGEKIDKVEQLTQYQTNGKCLSEFADFYFWNVYSKMKGDQAVKTTDTIFRLKAIIIILIAFLLLIFLSNTKF